MPLNALNTNQFNTDSEFDVININQSEIHRSKNLKNAEYNSFKALTTNENEAIRMANAINTFDTISAAGRIEQREHHI